MSGARADTGIKRKVTFQGWCRRCVSGWSGPEWDFKGDAAFDLISHEMDVHGGQRRGDDEQ